MSGTKPGIDHLKVGDEVVVVFDGRYREQVITPVRITKINRVWWHFEELHTRVSEYTGKAVPPRTWKMRRETQCEGDFRGNWYGSRFATAEQLKWEDRENAADRYLGEIGLHTHSLKIVLSKVDLANMIRKHLGLEEI